MGAGLLALVVLVIIHLFANKSQILGWVWHGRFLSLAAGISFAYVFVDLLPSLEKGQPALKKAFDNIIPYLDLHAYVLALLGVLFYYGLHTQNMTVRNFWLSISGYLLFNFFVGASLSDSSNPEIQPIALFTIALGMHYFIHDHNCRDDNPLLYQSKVRWLLAGVLVLGFVVGKLTHIPESIVAIVISFVSGGMILNSLRYELPKREKVGYVFFVIGSLLYTGIILVLNIP